MKLMSGLISKLVTSLFERTQQAAKGHPKMKPIQALVTDLRDCKTLVESMEKESTLECFYYPLFREIRFSTELRLLLSSAGYYSRVYDGGVVIRVGFPSKKVADVFARLMVRRGWQCEAVFYSF